MAIAALDALKKFTAAVIAANTGTASGSWAAGNDARITGAAQKASNLSDLASAATARTNLGLGDSATKATGTTAGTVAAGDDSRIILGGQSVQPASAGPASLLGVTADIAAAATTAVNAYMAGRATLGHRYADFDLPLTLTVGDLDRNDVMPVGNAQLASDSLITYFRPVARNRRSFTGKINRLQRKTAFTNTAAALTAGTVNVCIFGDSISTFGGDMTGVTMLAGTGIETSPTGITYGDSYASRLRDTLVGRFPAATFNFYDRAVGGARLNDWAASKTFNSVTKTWIEHVKDTSADLLIIAFGMNHDAYAYAEQFSYLLNQVLDHMTANFSKVPDVVVVTPPRPTWLDAAAYGSAAGQTSRHIVANVIRNGAARRNYYVADVGKLSDLLRCGTDYTHPIPKARTTIASEWTLANGATYNSGTDIIYLNAANASVSLPTLSKDFTIQWTFNAGAVTGEEALTLTYNVLGTAECNKLMIYPNSGGSLKVYSYARNADSGNWGTAPTASYTTTSIVSKRFRVEKRGGVLEVFMNDALILRDLLDVWDAPGTFKLARSVAGTTITMNLYLLRLYTSDYPTYTPAMLEREMFGTFVSGDSTLKSPHGGNGLNHPSSIGLELTYVPVMDELVSDIAALA